PSPDGRYLWRTPFAGAGAPSLYDWTTATVVPLPALASETAATGVRFTADGRAAVFVSGTSIVRYELSGAVRLGLATLDGVAAAVPSPDGRQLAVLGSREGQAGLWRLDPQAGSWELLLAAGPGDLDAGSLVWSPAGDRIAYLRAQPAAALEVVDVAAPHTIAVVEAAP